MKKYFALLVAALALSATVARAQEFLTINPDVRTAGMANASIATSGGAYSIFNNAASSLFDQDLLEVGFSYAPWMSDVRSGYNLMALGGYYSFNQKHSIAFGTRFYREPKIGPDTDYPFFPTDENNNPLVETLESFRPLSLSADLAYGYRINQYLGVFLRP